MANNQLGVKRRLLKIGWRYAPYLVISTLMRIANLLLWCGLLVFPAWIAGKIFLITDVGKIICVNLAVEIDKNSYFDGICTANWDNSLFWNANGELKWPIILLVMFILGIGKGLLRYGEQLSGHYVAFRVLARLRIELFDGVYPQAPAVCTSYSSAQILKIATSDIDCIEVFYAHTVAPAIAAIVVPIVVVTGIWVTLGIFSALVALLGIIFGGIFLPWCGQKQEKRAAKPGAKIRVEQNEMISKSINGWAEIKQYQAEQQFLDQAERLSNDLAYQSILAGHRQGWRQAVLYIWPILTAMAMVWVYGLEHSSWLNLTYIPEILGSSAAILGLNNALYGISNLANTLPMALAAGQRLFTLVDRKPAVVDPPNEKVKVLGSKPYSLQMEKVSFSYNAGNKVIKDVSLTVKPGQMVALVGPTGSGKSTLAALAIRVWDVDEGSIKICDYSGLEVDVRDLPLEEIRQTIGLVTQRNVLIRKTVADNLLLANPQATEREMRESCAQAHFNLQDFEDELDTFIDQGASVTDRKERRTVSKKNTAINSRNSQRELIGRQLSGGEAQRLCLARALLRKPGVLILDEATSYQDSITQKKLMDSIRELEIPILVIAHRLNTIREADQIHLMEAGEIVESGTWDELLALNGRFRSLVAQGENQEENTGASRKNY